MRSNGRRELAGLLSPGGKGGRLADPVMGPTPELRRRRNPVADAPTAEKRPRLTREAGFVSFMTRDDRGRRCVREQPEDAETFTEPSSGIDSGFRLEDQQQLLSFINENMTCDQCVQEAIQATSK